MSKVQNLLQQSKQDQSEGNSGYSNVHMREIRMLLDYLHQ
jgi:hypothetical protein